MDFERYMDCISRYFNLEYPGDYNVVDVMESALDAYNFGLSVPEAAGNLIEIIKENTDGSQD